MPGIIFNGEQDNYPDDSLFGRPPVNREIFPISRKHPDTSRTMAKKALPKTGTQRATIYALIEKAGNHGYTCDEMELELNRSHQSVSATIHTLMRDRWIIDSGRRRTTRYANPAIVWIANPNKERNK